MKNVPFNNPSPGTIISNLASSNEFYEFSLTAQNVNEGTSTLTQFQASYFDEKENITYIPEEAISMLTLEQCYNYPNWMGGIRVPGFLQGSEKLAKMVGEHIN